MDDREDDEQNYLDVPEECYCPDCGTLLSVDQEDGANDTGLVDILFCENC